MASPAIFAPKTVTSLWDLRGFAFYTTASSDKDTSQDDFHGLLIVKGSAGRQVYDWSPVACALTISPDPRTSASA